MWRVKDAGAIRPRTFQPSFFPDQLAGCLAPSMALSIAAHCLEKHGVADPSQTRAVSIFPHLLEAPMDRKAVPTESRHLRHKRQPIQATSLVERRENLRQTPDLDYFTGAQTRSGIQESADYKLDRTSNSLARSD